jgi:hypothetical protein
MYIHSVPFFHMNSNDGNCCYMDQARSTYNRSFIYLDFSHISTGYSFLLDMVGLHKQTYYYLLVWGLLVIVDGLFACLLILLLFSIYTHLLVTIAVDDTEILNFTCLNDENYSLWVIHIEADLVSYSVAMIMTDVFQTKNKKRLTY